MTDVRLQRRAPIRSYWTRGEAFAALATTALAIATGGLLAYAPRVALAAATAAGLTILWLYGGQLRVLAALGAIAALPVVAGVSHYGSHAAGKEVLSSAPTALRHADDVGLALGWIALLATLGAVRQYRRPMAGALALALLSQCLGMVYSHSSLRIEFEAAWQDIRWFGAIGWGIYLGRRLRSDERFRWAFRLLLAWNALQAAFALYEIAQHQTTGARFGVPVAGGALGHPTLGAIAGTMLLVLVACDVLARQRHLTVVQWQVATLAGLLGVVLSTRSKPFIALASVALLAVAYGRRGPRWRAAAAFVAIPALFVLVLPLAGQASQKSGDALLVNVTAHAVPRVALLDGARHLAAKTFPFGWGLGTYGSNLDENVEEATFRQAGLGSTYGFSSSDPSFRSDSMLAHVLAERGWIGLVTWFAALIALLLAFLRMSRTHLFPAAALTTAVALSPVTASFRDGAAAFLVLLPGALCLDPEDG
jgi:hypothetical protein